MVIIERKTEGAIKNGQYRETGNIGYTRRIQAKQKIQHRKPIRCATRPTPKTD
jgi:hypothetical protein